jgi:hypothetical protein
MFLSLSLSLHIYIYIRISSYSHQDANAYEERGGTHQAFTLGYPQAPDGQGKAGEGIWINEGGSRESAGRERERERGTK